MGVVRVMPRLTPISGCGAKAPACFLVDTGSARLLLDLGYGAQPGVWPDVSRVGRVDALLLSHGHRDHAGALKLLPRVGSPRVYATNIVRRTLPQDIESGSLPPGTPAERLTRSRRASYMRWNVHPRLSDNARLVRETGARTVLPAFGDARHLAAWQSAFAPARIVLEGPRAL